ncbi:hypothetical protein C5S29_07170, partial [ANME-1 cluster archaeon GoMg3.2]|nr:hypothetical protein [ANME-1 cluster archaeon GoMg3.2]
LKDKKVREEIKKKLKEAFIKRWEAQEKNNLY